MARTLQCMNCYHYFSSKRNIGGLSADKAVAGGLLAGPVGAIVGASMGKNEQNSYCPKCGSTNCRLVN